MPAKAFSNRRCAQAQSYYGLNQSNARARVRRTMRVRILLRDLIKLGGKLELLTHYLIIVRLFTLVCLILSLLWSFLLTSSNTLINLVSSQVVMDLASFEVAEFGITLFSHSNSAEIKSLEIIRWESYSHES